MVYTPRIKKICHQTFSFITVSAESNLDDIDSLNQTTDSVADPEIWNRGRVGGSSKGAIPLPQNFLKF